MSTQTLERESKPWNFAGSYIYELIGSQVIELKYAIRLAKFGYTSLEDRNQPDTELASNRYNALEWISHLLIDITESAYFSVNKADKIEITKLNDKIVRIEQRLSSVKKEQEDENTGLINVSIQESIFSLIYTMLKKVRMQLIVILNRNGLIFEQSDEFTLDSLKERLTHG